MLLFSETDFPRPLLLCNTEVKTNMLIIYKVKSVISAFSTFIQYTITGYEIFL